MARCQHLGGGALRAMGFMRQGDAITHGPDRLVYDAKQKVIALAANYRPAEPATDLRAPGRSVAASLKSQLWNMRMGGLHYRIRRDSWGAPSPTSSPAVTFRQARSSRSSTCWTSSGKRSCGLRRAEDPGADPAHAQEGETAAQLREPCIRATAGCARTN